MALRNRSRLACGVLTVTVAVLDVTAHPSQSVPPGTQASNSPEGRAVRYLTVEVPRWRREHPCYSCHSNGDAARALIAAASRSHAVGAALDDTLGWLKRPEQWDTNAQGGGIDDKPLARIQFAAALRSAVETGRADPSALRTAAEIVAKDQNGDGSWRLDSSQSVASPATYGTVLATWAALRTLRVSGVQTLTPSAQRAEAWLRAYDPKNIPDAAGVVLALADATDGAGRASLTRALDVLLRGQGPDGGWGLYLTSASEPFDTAVAVLAVAAVREREPSNERLRGALDRAREFLIRRQLSDGSWPETTRPAGQESYAQRISTSGWATLALFATQ